MAGEPAERVVGRQPMKGQVRIEVIEGDVADYVWSTLAAWRPGMIIPLRSFAEDGGLINWRLTRHEELRDGRLRVWLRPLSGATDDEPIRWQRPKPTAKAEPSITELMQSIRVSKSA